MVFNETRHIIYGLDKGQQAFYYNREVIPHVLKRCRTI